MAEAGGLWVICDDLEKGVVTALQSQRATAPIFLPNSVLSAHSSFLAILSLSRATIDYLAVATSGRRGSELERKVTLGPAIKLESALLISEVLEAMPLKFRQHVSVPTYRSGGVPPKTWDCLLEKIVEIAKIPSQDVSHLDSVLQSRRDRKKQSVDDIVNLERDASAVSLEAFRGSAIRQRYLSAAPTSIQAPFIKALEQSGAAVLEDRMIDHDLSTFPGAEAMRRHIVGAVQITTETGTLTLVNANRTGIENTLGVDLVYYHHHYDAFTMVQYKRLTGKKEPVYHPNSDKSYELEVVRMKEFCAEMNDPPTEGFLSYRFSHNPFFFKFCASEQDVHWSRMIPGMYLPLDLWRRFVDSKHAVGPKGGIVIGEHNAYRRLTNSQFAQLLRGGWIGSVGIDSAKINAIIASELAADKSVIAAIHRDGTRADDYLRDSHGRFAGEDDPAAI